ncbi:DUF4369 domain-containing protein [Marinilabiliaceae bacterium JC017]|nr:DUF4369 domain-containing protein [Marinilabiliaceae bacterium JC017]
MLQKLILLKSIVLLLLLSSCHRNEEYQIIGEITGVKDSTKVYLQDRLLLQDIDSTYIVNNEFQFGGFFESEPQFCMLYLKSKGKLFSTYLLMQNEKVLIKGDLSDFNSKTLCIQGGKYQEDVNHLNEVTRTYLNKRDSIVNLFMIAPDSIKRKKTEKTWATVAKLDSVRISKTISFIKENTNSYFSLINLWWYHREIPKDTLKLIYDNFSPNLSETEYGNAIEFYLKNNELKEGDNYFDFEVKDINGNSCRLSDVKNKYILLNFSKPYCGASIYAVNQFKWVEKDHGDSISIVNFYESRNPNLWHKFVNEYKVPGLNLCDEKGAFSEILIKYGIWSSPTFILIDEKGKIKDKSSGCGPGYMKWYLKKCIN